MVLPTPGNKRWTFALSLTLQAAALSLLMLIPLIYTDQLSKVMMRGSFFAPTPPPPPPLPRPAETQPQPRSRTPRVLKPLTAFLLNHTPKPLADIARNMIEDLPESPLIGVVGSTSAPTGAIPGLGNATTTAPPPPPVVTEKKIEAAKPTAPIRVGGGVQNARMVRRVLPVYPPLAKQARVSGTVRLQGVISKEGTIQQLQVISGHPLLVAAALEAVRQWVYRPTLLNGDPVEVIAPIEVNFTLSGS